MELDGNFQVEPPVKVWITREGWIYLVILVFVAAGALLRNINLLMVMTGIMIAPLFLSWRAVFLMLRRLAATRNRPHSLFAGQTVHIDWKVVCGRSWFPSWHLVILDQLRNIHRESAAKVRVVIPLIRPGETIYGTFQAHFPQRGRFRVGPAKVVTRFPFGLIAARLDLADEVEYLVAPALGRLKASWDRRLLSHASGSQAIKRKRGAQDEEFFALRQWRSGDSRKHIHWRATAKTNQLVVKQFDSRSDRDFVLLLDLWAPEGSGQMETERAEWALSFAATVMPSLATLVRGKVAIGICGLETVVSIDLCHPQFCAKVWDELATAQVSNSPEIVPAIAQIADQIPGGTPFYVMSTRPRPRDWHRLPGGTELAGKLAGIEPWLRWLPVADADFAETFELPESLRTTAEPHEEPVHVYG